LGYYVVPFPNIIAIIMSNNRITVSLNRRGQAVNIISQTVIKCQHSTNKAAIINVYAQARQ
jgi:hypothetical protein